MIQCDNVWKQFRLGLAPSFDRVTEILQHAFVGLANTVRKKSNRDSPERSHWALRDVSFNIQEGEVLGIIGRNGAGKSTLLKILSRITRPTKGSIRTRGRIASLLEVGTGFHPELTGRENVFLNGSILGMTRREINAKFDQIVAFAEVEKFLDTPVKRYSSGMYTRLAFAVAAFLEPEILIVDEVLAVGDSEFQQKCLAKMDSIAKSGRTVLFVSHNLKAVRSLCSRGILLNQGQLVCDGSVDQCLTEYRNFAAKEALQTKVQFDCQGSDFDRIEMQLQNTELGVMPFGQPLQFKLTLASLTTIDEMRIQFRLRDVFGNLVLHGDNGKLNQSVLHLPSVRLDQPTIEPTFNLAVGKVLQISCDLGAVPLLPGKYHLELFVTAPQLQNQMTGGQLSFEMESPAQAEMSDTLAADLSALHWPTQFAITRP